MRYRRNKEEDAPQIKRNCLNDVSKEEISQSISSAIKRQIKMHNDDQLQLANEFDIPYTTFNGYVNGTSNIPAYLVARIADKYDLSSDDLIFPEGTKNSKQLKLDNNDTQLMLESLAIFLLISNFQCRDIVPGSKDKPMPMSTEPPWCNVYCHYDPDETVPEDTVPKQMISDADKEKLFKLYPELIEADMIMRELDNNLSIKQSQPSIPQANAIMCSDYNDDDFLHWHFILESFMGITRVEGLSNSEKFDFMKKAIEANIKSHGFAENYDWGFNSSIW